MTDRPDPQRILHDETGTQSAPAPPDAAQAHARIIEALRDPFALAVALLGSEAVRMPPPPAEEEPRQRPPRPRKQSRRTAADILRPQPGAPRW